MKNLGKLQEAKLYLQKATEIDPNLTEAYLSLSTMKDEKKDPNWENQLFAEGFLKNKNNRELVNILFARSNVLHKKRKFKENAENLVRANNLKLSIYKSSAKSLIKKTNKLKITSTIFREIFMNILMIH